STPGSMAGVVAQRDMLGCPSDGASEDGMRILVMGTGGVGGYYGGMLADHGNDVTFVARGAHLAAIRQNGLEVRTQGRTIRIQPAKATDNPAEVRDVEL